MCTVSMIMDWKENEWARKYYPQPNTNTPPIISPVQFPTKDEIDEFRRLLERAREYDKKMGQPDCELESKRNKLKDMAKELGVEIEFV